MPAPVRMSLREPQSTDRLRRTFAQSLSAVDLAEPLRSLDETQPARVGGELMAQFDYDVLGVRREGLIAGWVHKENLSAGTLNECMEPFAPGSVLPSSAGLDQVLVALSSAECVFIEWLGEISGVITHRDLQKAPLRMWLFGAITVLDSNMTWAIEELHPDGGWKDHISPGRLEKAINLQAERERRGGECRLVDCLQLKDKADIILQEKTSAALLGGLSRREAERWARDIEMLRNHLAHAQELERDHLTTAARLAASIGTIVQADVVQRIVETRRNAPSPAPH